MALKSGKVGGESGSKNTVMMGVAVGVLVLAGVVFWLRREKDPMATYQEQLQSVAPAVTNTNTEASSGGLDVPTGETGTAGAAAAAEEEAAPTEEEIAANPTKPLKPKSSAVMR